jgi:hypothetical protein
VAPKKVPSPSRQGNPGTFDHAKALFVQQWASTFIDGSFRFGMKTPMEQKPTAAGCELRFRPVGTPTAKMMDELDEGHATGKIWVCQKLLLRSLSKLLKQTIADHSRPFCCGFCFVFFLAGTNPRLVLTFSRVC